MEQKNSKILVGGFVPFTTIDYPGKISAVVFLSGCPWRCVYCCNPHLLERPATTDPANWKYILDLLDKRRKMLDAVVLSGGEATMQADELLTAIRDIHKISKHYKIGLHTNGCAPSNLATILPFVDWVGLDIKAPLENYDTITQVKNSGAAAYKSLELLKKSGKEFEVRTTADPKHLTKEDVLKIAETIKVKNYAIQRYRPVNTDNPNNPPMSEITKFFTDKEFLARLRKLIPALELRF